MTAKEEVPLFFNSWVTQLQKDVDQLQLQLDGATEKLRSMLKNSTVVCTSQIATGGGCNAVLRIGDLTYIQTYWYVEPYSCSGGDYWKPGEGVFKCPRCGHRNRLYDSPEIVKLKSYFARVVEERSSNSTLLGG